MKPSPNAIAIIARYEGFRPRPYKHGSDPWTIGYGETRGIGPGTAPWTEKYARARLVLRVDRDFAPAVDRFRARHNLRWSQNQFDALTCFAYNLGAAMFSDGAPTGDSLRSALKSRSVAAVKHALMLYVMPGTQFEDGLRRRRAAEGEMFAKPDDRLARLRAELAQRRAQLRVATDRLRRRWLMRRIRSLRKAIATEKQ